MPFLTVDDALVAERRLRELDLYGARNGTGTFADPKLGVGETILVNLVSSSSTIQSSTSFSPEFSAIKPSGGWTMTLDWPLDPGRPL